MSAFRAGFRCWEFQGRVILGGVSIHGFESGVTFGEGELGFGVCMTLQVVVGFAGVRAGGLPAGARFSQTAAVICDQTGSIVWCNIDHPGARATEMMMSPPRAAPAGLRSPLSLIVVLLTIGLPPSRS